ncbi:hypothetical protein EYC84_006865 [Monilinia fructicola]|uniref:Sterol regulatory element-binding protein 1 C-terminal domain-containing protein n=1 Tax=Monilinia fructicola TaxID=38448 RepID=A0A5M9K9N8_MONFR|nr:hypothetical protein EYC84_006865 [Monilinia fructicola]
MGFGPIQQPINPYQYAQDFSTPGPSPSSDQGMIPVPDDMRRLHGQMNQEAFAVPTQYLNQNRQPIGPNAWNGGYFGKLMVGSLAGLMIMQGFSEAEQESDTPGARGLMALPTQFLRTRESRCSFSIGVNFRGYHLSARQTVHYLQCSLSLGLLLYIFLPSLFRPKPNAKDSKSANLAAAPSLASSIQVRRQAWLTAIQTVWVPRHNFFLEAVALCMKVGKYTCRNVVGPSLYSFLTGATEEQEVARIKAWSIALDAQLTGGDVEVSKSRLTLTLLASGTLPDTPARLMLKHYISVFCFRNLAQEMARWKWNEAKQMQQILSQSKEQHDELPEYLATLLEQKCDDVLVDAVVQRVLTILPGIYQPPTTPMSTVVWTVWWMTLPFVAPLMRLQPGGRVLLFTKLWPKVSRQRMVIWKAIRALLKKSRLPFKSTSWIRSPNTRSSSSCRSRQGKTWTKYCHRSQGSWCWTTKDAAASNVNIKTSISNLPDIQSSVHCAMALAYLERFPMPAHPANAVRIIDSILLEKMHEHTSISSTCALSLEKFAGNLRLWIGGSNGDKSGLDTELKNEMVNKFMAILAEVVGMENDAGYGSMSDDDDDSEGC